MSSFEHGILIFEWLSGGGCWHDGVNPIENPELLRQGQQMLAAVTDDFCDAGFDVNSLIDSRLGVDCSGTKYQIASREELRLHLARMASQVDSILIIAPETDNRLVECLGWLKNEESRWLNPGLDFTFLAADKNRMQSYLFGFQLPVPCGAAGHQWQSQKSLVDSPKLVVKPFDGCGGEENFLVDAATLKSGPYEKFNQSGFRIEEFVSGVAVSVAVLGNGQGANEILKPMRQNVKPGTFGLFSHCTDDLSVGLVGRAVNLADSVLHVLPQFKGYIGIDLILGDKDVVIEVNPRITASYGMAGSPACWLRQHLHSA